MNQQNSGSQPSDGLATASLVMGILAIVIGGFVFGILAIVFAVMARKNGNTSGKATAGLIMGIISIALWAIILLVCGPMLCLFLGL